MQLRDGRKSTVIIGTVGTGGVAKGDLCVVSSNTFIKATAGPADGTVVAIALETASAGSTAKFELVQDRIVSAKYTGSTKTSLSDADITKVFDLSDSQTVNLDDTTGGCCYCIGYDNALKLIHFIVLPVKRAI